METVEYIICGHSHPDPVIEANTNAHREILGQPVTGQGCRREMHWTVAYRCVNCARWFHYECIKTHFAEHTDHT